MVRLRVGIIIILVSWLPIAQVVLTVAHNNGNLTSEATSNTVRLVIWGIQILVGFVGIALVGQTALPVVKQAGWKKAPKRLWNMFWYGQAEKPST